MDDNLIKNLLRLVSRATNISSLLHALGRILLPHTYLD